MPRVSEEHLERRRRQILEAARACFVRKGIHETSMQDIFAEAGLSAGAVYRYFKSKNEIIEANVATVVGELHAFFDELGRSEPLLPVDQVMERLAGKVVDLSGEDGPLRLAPQAWALALHDPEIATYVAENVAGLRRTWTAYIRRMVEAGLLPADTDIEAAAKTLFSLMPGFLVQRLVLKDFSPEELGRGVRALSRDSMLTLLA
ncbi:TetR/AcrR family transcriptional regulator [Actinomadura madurae]|uniref:TetR/AcrR family transcriptional regulator n=1 Tax=Actinomadura madurae TaxID=1993 RepID=UPI0020265C14|nr:TetR/AcrR family transcriptional regulator [Actinomadura madurae]MCP9954581.1 TetR/AcrR family transcriptional regulator [Actinomadura madurae]MCQ0004625.1 TetR/AcrR family transcriptional regulator [Actinomadura madurae]URN00074.1 TetR/AcrR family transcriptional regulator [Actinomadura madurae]URN02236.1 TetR/AcrR family transcriptional regulator [Actinomadura madurae]